MTKIDTSVSDSVMENINEGKAQMHGRTYVFSMHFLSFLIFLSLMVLLFFISSLIYFTVVDSGAWLLMFFGYGGINDLLLSLPWLMIMLLFTGIALFVLVGREKLIMYKLPGIFILLILVMIVVVVGWLLYKTQLHDNFAKQARISKHPVLEWFYPRHGYTGELHNAVIGRVSSVDGGGFNINTISKEGFSNRVYVKIGEQTLFIPDEPVNVGGIILIRGQLINNLIKADDVYLINNFKNGLSPERFKYNFENEIK